jgi:hypothetical protein
MEVNIKVPDELAAKARAQGVSVEVYVQEILSRQALETTGEQRLQAVRAAIDGFLSCVKGTSSRAFEQETSSTRVTSTDGYFRCGRLGRVGLVL